MNQRINLKINILHILCVAFPIGYVLTVVFTSMMLMEYLLGSLGSILGGIIGIVLSLFGIMFILFPLVNKIEKIKQYRRDNDLFDNSHQKFYDILDQNSIHIDGGFGGTSYKICKHCEKPILDPLTHYESCNPIIHSQLKENEK